MGVAYGSNTRQVEKILLECAVAHPEILKHPKPFALFENFGDSSLDFGLYFFVRDSFVDPRIKSALRYAIDDRFRESGITIPFPQRDVHLFNTVNPVYTPNTTAINNSIETSKNDMIDE